MKTLYKLTPETTAELETALKDELIRFQMDGYIYLDTEYDEVKKQYVIKIEIPEDDINDYLSKKALSEVLDKL